MTNPQQGLPVVFLMGPTASGKTALAVELCQQMPFEIISVDSAMVYKGMDIGTAKPGADILSKAPHRLIDICDPAERYSAGGFRKDALREIKKIHDMNKIPLLVGGTGLYFRALERGIADLPSADQAIRQILMEQATENGWGEMHRRLQQVDPVAAERIHPNDPQRIQRALEVYEISGRPISSFYSGKGDLALACKIKKIAIAPRDRSVLHGRILRRLEEMMEFGFIKEVEGLYQRADLSADTPAMRTVGYRQVWQYLQGSLGETEMLEKAVVATRQMARRQLTWLRSEDNVDWFDTLEGDFGAEVLRILRDNPMLSSRL